MARPLEAADLVDLAEFLIQDETQVPDDRELWADCEDARSRAAVSRSYYAVFLALKARLLDARIWARPRQPGAFPERDVHSKLLTALQGQLGPAHLLVADLKALRRLRAEADYDLRTPHSTDGAVPSVDRAADALDRVDTLSAGDIKAIANRLYDGELRG